MVVFAREAHRTTTAAGVSWPPPQARRDGNSLPTGEHHVAELVSLDPDDRTGIVGTNLAQRAFAHTGLTLEPE